MHPNAKILEGQLALYVAVSLGKMSRLAEWFVRMYKLGNITDGWYAPPGIGRVLAHAGDLTALLCGTSTVLVHDASYHTCMATTLSKWENWLAECPLPDIANTISEEQRVAVAVNLATSWAMLELYDVPLQPIAAWVDEDWEYTDRAAKARAAEILQFADFDSEPLMFLDPSWREVVATAARHTIARME